MLSIFSCLSKQTVYDNKSHIFKYFSYKDFTWRCAATHVFIGSVPSKPLDKHNSFIHLYLAMDLRSLGKDEVYDPQNHLHFTSCDVNMILVGMKESVLLMIPISFLFLLKVLLFSVKLILDLNQKRNLT